MKPLFLRFCAVSIVLWASGSGRLAADNIDLKLYTEAQKTIEQLNKNDIKNVGVLHFRSQKGNGPQSFNLGTISSSMALRLQNALILQMPADQPIGITRDASAAALANKVGGWYKNPSERKRLFSFSYKPVWGTASIKPDAFLTGVVRMNPPPKKPGDMETTTVVIEMFTAKAPEKMIKLQEFTVATDRHILREFGQSYGLSARSLKGGGRGLSGLDRDQRAVRDARRRDVGDTTEDSVSPDNLFGLSLKILYDGASQNIRPDSKSGGEWRVDPPPAGSKVVIRLRNTGSRAPRLGAAMSVNGRSLWKQQTGDVVQEQIWLFDSSSTTGMEFGGFWMDVSGKNVLPFKVLSPEESEKRLAEYGDKVGLLNVDVFEPRPGETKDDSEMQISLARSIRTPGKKGSATMETLGDAKRAVILSDGKLFRRERSTALKRNLIVASDEPVEGGSLSLESMPNPVRIGGITIRYYDPKGKGTSPDALQISN